MDISVSLTPELIGLIEERLQSGRYASTSDVVAEALRLLDKSDASKADAASRLSEAWKEGLASGDAGPLDFAELKAAGRKKRAVSSKG